MTLHLRRPRRARPLAILAASIALVAGSQAAGLLAPATSVSGSRPAAGVGSPAIDAPIAPPDAPVSGTPVDLHQIDHSIAAWTANVRNNAKDFISAANLGLLYEARARLSGDLDDYRRADEAATRSLAIVPIQPATQALHARLRLAFHDFRAALSEAEELDREVPDQPAVLAIVGDARLELGDIDEAEATYHQIERLAPGAAVTARLARVAFLRGDPSAAVRLASQAYDDAHGEGTTGPSLSWYAYLTGTMALSAGTPRDAATWFSRAIDAWPGSFLALAGQARADAALGNVDAAIAGYRRAIAVAPQPDALAALGDLLSLAGDDHGAQQQYDTVLAIARLQSNGELVFNRQLVLFDVNHDRDLAEALTLADHELASRHDVYGYDADAWALLANGRAGDADTMMRKALALGTRDALLLYHAGEIAHALGDDARARDLLGQALAIDGGLDPLAAHRAAADLAGLAR